MGKLIIEKILGADLIVLNDDGRHRRISFTNLKGNEGSTFTIDCDENRIPRFKIDIHLETDGYDLSID